MKIIFEKSLSSYVLDIFGKKTDKDGYIINSKTGRKVLSSSDNEEVHISEFAGITPGSEIYLKSDIISLIKYVEKSSLSRWHLNGSKTLYP